MLEIPPTPDTPPEHHSEKYFRLFEKVIAVIVNRWPEELAFDPGTMSTISYSARLRDAMASHLKYRWASTLVDPERLAAIRGQLVVRAMGNRVWVQHKVKRKKEVSEIVDSLCTVPIAAVQHVETPTKTDVYALAHLVSRRIISGPFVFTGQPELVNWAEHLRASYDIALRPEEDGSWTLL